MIILCLYKMCKRVNWYKENETEFEMLKKTSYIIIQLHLHVWFGPHSNKTISILIFEFSIFFYINENMIKHNYYNDCFQFSAYIPINKVHWFKEGGQFLTWLKPNYRLIYGLGWLSLIFLYHPPTTQPNLCTMTHWF